MKPILILKMGPTLTQLAEQRGDFDDWIAAPLNHQGIRTTVVSPFAGETLPRPEGFSGVVISGSHAFVTDREPWSEAVAAWIPDVIAAHVLLLGICYGHQLIALALGGRVGNSPGGVEIGTVDLTLTDAAARDPLFAGRPGSFGAHVSHIQSVLQLPPGARILASSQNEPHHAFAISDRTWGLQFHPEFDAHIMQTYVREFSDLLESHGFDPEAVRNAVAPTPQSQEILSRFAHIARERS